MAKSGMSESDVESDDDGKKTNGGVDGEYRDDSVCIATHAVKTSTPISILIESLVKNLCYLYERDLNSAARNYNIICEGLHKMKLIDESYKMVEFEGMINQYQRAVHHLLTTASGDHPVPIQPVWPDTDVTNEWSHYHREFDEIEFIAGGGFGKVYRVKHKLDGTEYAVKKIFLRSDGIKSVRDYLSEVKTFASLNHSNIVQYKAAWLELGAEANRNMLTEPESDSEDTYSDDDDGDEDSSSEDDPLIFPPNNFSEHRRLGDSSEFEVSFKNGSCFTPCHYPHSNNNNSIKRTKRHSISEGGNAICTLEEIQKMKLQAKPHHKWATLYIQMALCQSTLKQWLDTRNNAESPQDINDSALIPVKLNMRFHTIMEILRQLLQGLEYIHSKRMVHHDIKPSNIFIQLDNGSLLVQLGDFGLACPLQCSRHSLALGTRLYAAPEQLGGKCDSKSDMYSLGIVLFELAETFKTDMERVRSITELRKGHLPSHLLVQQPQLAHIIGQLVTQKPQERPDATTLLKRITADAGESVLVNQLKCQIAEKDEEISRLKQLLKTAGVNSE